MTPDRIHRLRGAVQFGLPVTVEPAELTEMLNAVEARHNQEPAPARPRQDRGFTRWLMELETIAAAGFPASDIAWVRENCWRKGMSPAAALDAFEKGEEA